MQSAFNMKKNLLPSLRLSARIWFFTSACFAIAIMFYFVSLNAISSSLLYLAIGFVCSLLGSIPALISFFIALLLLKNLKVKWQIKIFLFMVLILIIAAGYAVIVKFISHGFFNTDSTSPANFFQTSLLITLVLFACSLTAILLNLQRLAFYLSDGNTSTLSYSTIFHQLFTITNTKTNIMDYETTSPAQPQQVVTSSANKILIKGLITGGLILLMLVPTIFIINLISEREARQKEVVKEVSSKWASAQTLSAPFITVPYTETFTNAEGKLVQSKTQLIVLADKLLVNGKVLPEERPRSIYKVLLYRADVNFSGTFKPSWPADIDTANIDFANAKLCFSLSDFKGIEEEIMVDFNNQKLMLDPGMPVNDLGEVGLSVPINISAEIIKAGVPFKMDVKLKGSEQLHFIPMSVNSKFLVASKWPNPSFDGNSLPTQRNVNDSGFAAQWSFNRANLPFGTVVKTGALKIGTTAFGVSLVQPADQYNKTTRSVKYAILLIGLTFALFFIIELMQKKPMHPVQYVLVGLALVIFYTLLLSISEYILFDYAYLIAAIATIVLITLYAKSHFNTWKSAAIFGSLLSALYGFIFILISLEDTALLVGSIGLFIILALVMYGSRKINWYGGNGVGVGK